MESDLRGWCSWAMSSSAMRSYHDEEWGVPISDDRRLFEKICLEAFQCGLSWSTILMRRQRLREVFASFDIQVLATWTEEDVQRIVVDPSIIRHRGKISSVISNARACLDLVGEMGSLNDYLWSFASFDEADLRRPSPPSTSTESTLLSKDLKRRGWTFVGPTTMYALMQSVGMVNDHDVLCPRRELVSSARRDFFERSKPRN